MRQRMQRRQQQSCTASLGPTSAVHTANGLYENDSRPVRGGSTGFELGLEMPRPAGLSSASSAGRISTDMAMEPRFRTRTLPRLRCVYVILRYWAESSRSPRPAYCFSCCRKYPASFSAVSLSFNFFSSAVSSASSSESDAPFFFFFFLPSSPSFTSLPSSPPLLSSAPSARPSPASRSGFSTSSPFSARTTSSPPPSSSPASPCSRSASSSSSLSESTRSSAAARPWSRASLTVMASLITLKTSTLLFSE
mmetsp:Transcript_24088/g.81193  ORF Transcript_24088/g.81193 Transcript_24088/m.81193 type:complete len:251 (-) Transcript_24088:4757-5509(-)